MGGVEPKSRNFGGDCECVMSITNQDAPRSSAQVATHWFSESGVGDSDKERGRP